MLHEMGEMARALDYLEGWMPGLRQARACCTATCRGTSRSPRWRSAKVERAWDAYRAGVHPGGSWGPPINVVSDCGGVPLARRARGRAARPELWREVHDYALKSFPKAGVPFADAHVAVACVADGDFATLERLVGEMRERIAAGKYPPGGVVATIAEGFGAYAQSDWNAAIRHFEQALPETVRIGGSRAQRDLVEHTLIAAYLKAGRPADARRSSRSARTGGGRRGRRIRAA